MMTNKLIFKSEMKNQIFQSNLCASQKQLQSNQFLQNELSNFIKMSLSPIFVAETGAVN